MKLIETLPYKQILEAQKRYRKGLITIQEYEALIAEAEQMDV